MAQLKNEQLLIENSQLKTALGNLSQEFKILKLKLGMVQENREHLETQLSEIKAENEELKETVENLSERLTADTPILSPRSVDDSVSEQSCDMESTRSSKKIGQEENEFYTETGPDFDSRWYKNISISKTHPDYVVLKNNSRDMHQCLDDFLFSRIVDGVATVTVAPLPLGIILAPESEFTVHAGTVGATEIPGRRCVLHRYSTFGRGKVTENIILDERGKETANHVLCVFQE
ncbi:hypothetical protein GCK72_006113 [Caenorhabditis remanei]|uniref:Uncharacterized protein n=1 Tax=Caenorhabditis remanei TaxID=31234 RepID=A0A6A5HHF4_CAERE|nr:hypothetical protein GCK72_006113 [Caenorhabditis remanei]KAF1766157.1 hypothetical protein GCK72_006113 [Caenorhabditis remanei]